jgi:hemerythrin-like domain-containing protein
VQALSNFDLDQGKAKVDALLFLRKNDVAKGQAMVEMIDALRREHFMIAQLLDKLEREFLVLRLDGQSNYDLIDLLIEYFESFPDRVHHRKEDLVYRKLKLRVPQVVDELVDLETEHKSLDRLIGKFSAAVGRVDRHQELPGERVFAAVNNFIDFSREHMKKEDEGLFPLAERTLLPEDWTSILYSNASMLKSPEYRGCVSSNNALYRKIRAIDSSLEFVTGE